MVEKKYPKYVTTDSDIWNSADEAYFYVVKKEAKPLTSMITPIIENALESGLLREATQEEIDNYILKEDIEKRLNEGRFNRGCTYKETIENYYIWKKHYDENKSKNTKKIVEKIEKEVSIDDIKNVLDDKTPITNDNIVDTIPTKPLTPTENALKQKASVRTDNMNN
jgi:hypothetical protein